MSCATLLKKSHTAGCLGTQCTKTGWSRGLHAQYEIRVEQDAESASFPSTQMNWRPIRLHHSKSTATTRHSPIHFPTHVSAQKKFRSFDFFPLASLRDLRTLTCFNGFDAAREILMTCFVHLLFSPNLMHSFIPYYFMLAMGHCAGESHIWFITIMQGS